MAEKARIFLADASEDFRNLAKELLAGSGHRVVLEANSLREALGKIKQAKEKGVNVAIMDDSLTILRYTPSDGPEIAKELKKEIPDIKIIALTKWSTDWSNKNLDKIEVIQIGEKVTEM